MSDMPSVDLKTVRTTTPAPTTAAAELVGKLERALGGAPKLAIVFATSTYDQAALGRALRERMPNTRLIGASSAGEIDHEGIHHGSVVLAGLRGDFEVGVGLGRGLSIDAFAAGESAMASARAQLGAGDDPLDDKRHFGVVIDDGLRFKKEELLMGMLECDPGLNLVGGGATTTSMAPPAYVHVDGAVATDAALVALFRTDAAWEVMRSHCYEPTGRTLKITKVDESCTRALEIDGQPAAQRYADLLGVSIDELEFGQPNGFSSMPTGIRVGNEIFMRSPWKPLPDGSILFSNLLDEGVQFELMRSVDMIDSTRNFFERELPAKLAKPTATLLFQCGGRAWVAAVQGTSEAMSEVFRLAPSPVGFEVAFEIYRGFAINTTLTVLAFGESA
jgi:hypothetical protein